MEAHIVFALFLAALRIEEVAHGLSLESRCTEIGSVRI